MRHSSFSRSKSKRWQRLTASLTAIALIAGLLPLQAVTVMADTTTKEFEFVFSNTPNMEGLSVEYKFDDQTEWSDVANYIEVNSKDYKFSLTNELTNEESKGLSLRINLGKNYIMSGTVGNSPDDANPVALSESNTTQVENQNAFIYHYDDFTTGGRCFKLELFEQNATYPYLFEVRKDGHGEISFDQSLPNMEIDGWIVILSNQKTLDVTVTPDKNDEADPNDDDRLEVLRLAQFNADPIELSEEQKFASAANGVAYNSETKKFTFTIQGEATEFRGIEFIFSGAFNPYEFRFFIDDNSNLTGVAVEYSVEYKLSTDTEWKDADFAIRLPGNFPYGDKVNDLQNGKVVIDNNQGELKRLSFELPGNKWYENPENPGEWLYPTVDFRITIPAESAAILDSAFFGYMGQNGPDEGSVFIKESGSAPSTTYCTTDDSGNLTITFSNQDIFVNDCALPREFHLNFDSGFDPSDMYGAEFEIPCDNGWSISNEGKTVVFDCFDGNTISVTSTGNVVVERKNQQNGPTIFIVWSDKTDFSVTAANAPGYTAYHENENDRLVMDENYKIDVTVTAKGYDNTVLTRVNFEMANLKIEGYDSISPNPDYWENNNPDKDYTLTSGTYTVTFPHGTVTVELVDSDPTDNVSPKWSGYKETWPDDFDNTDHEAFKIETTAQVKLTFMPAEGYQIISNLELSGGDPEASNVALNLDTNNSCVISLGTEKNQMNDPFVQIGAPDPTGTPDPQGGNKAIFSGATGMTDEDPNDGIVVINYAHGSATVTHGDGTMPDGDIFNAAWDSNAKTVTIEYDGNITFTLSPESDYYTTCIINDQEQQIQETYSFDPSPNTTIDIAFTGATYTLEIGSFDKVIPEPVINTANNTINLTIKETGVFKVQTNGLLILDGEGASVEGKIVFEPESMIAFVNGAKVPEEMTLYDSYGNELDATSFTEWTQFKYENGLKWTRVTNSVIDNANFSYSEDKTIDNAVTVHDNDSCRIVDCKLTISAETKELGQLEISGYDSYLKTDTVTTPDSSDPSAYGFVLEGDSFTCKIMPIAGYRFSIRIDGKPLALDSDMLTKGDDGYWSLNYSGIAKDAKVQLEVGFEPLPELTIVAGENNSYTYNSAENTLTYTNGTVTINNDPNPFTKGPTVPTQISSDISFTITPNDGYVCIVTLPGNAQLCIQTETEYILKASDLMSDTNGSNNEIKFEFRTLTEDDYAKVEFESSFTESGSNYVLSYANGTVSIPTDMVFGDPVKDGDKTTFTIKQSVTELPITFSPAEGYTPNLEEFGPDYNQDPVGEWQHELTIIKTTSGDTVSYSYTLPINPIGGAEPTRLRVSFTQTDFLQTKVTYNYDGVRAGIEIGGNMLPEGELNNALIEYSKPLSTTASTTKQYVKDINGVPCVQMQLSITFDYYMSELKVSVDDGDTWLDYTEELPDTYDELLEAFGSQHTNIIIWVPVSDSYKIYTKAYKAVNTEEQTQIAVGNFLWFYDSKYTDSNDDLVKNAELVIKVVEVNGVPITTPKEGTSTDWQPIIKDGKVVGGMAVLPAGSKVTMELIPNYGTQLVKLGLNGFGFQVDQNAMYTYSFYVGPGNFHLQADFEEIPDVVDSDATDVISAGTIKLDDNEGAITNGTAVLFVGDTEPEDAEKALFENKAETAGVEVADYLNISLKQVVYQGVGKDENVVYSGEGQNVWDSNLSQLDSDATIELKLKDGIDPTTVKVLHYHGGVVKVLDAQYDAATNTLSFQTDSFSDYAIAYKANVYDVTVENGTAEPTTAAAGNTITLTANAAPAGQAFDKWTADSDSVTFADAESPETTFVMPTNNVVITANYADVYSITVTDGTASSETAIAGKTITLTAGAAPEGKTFDKWEVTSENVTLASAASATTTFTMPESNVEVKATYKDVYAVTVTSGTASPASAAEGDTVTLTADAAPAGKEFDKWEVTSGSITLASATTATTTFTMPASAVAVTATYKDIKYTVTFNANGHGTAPAAQTVTSGSKATKPTDPTASGYTFGGWYTDSACTKAYSFDTAVTANITLYAKWTAVTTPAPSTPAPTNTTTPTPTPEPEIVPSAELIPSGTAHVQDVGDVPVSVDPETGIMTIGTTGQGKRLEEITIDFENTTGLSGTMEYRVHVQDKGWLPWTEAGNPAGTEGESKRIEAIEIRLTGELAEYYSVEYCVHIQDYGDMQGWVADGYISKTSDGKARMHPAVR